MEYLHCIETVTKNGIGLSACFRLGNEKKVYNLEALALAHRAGFLAEDLCLAAEDAFRGAPKQFQDQLNELIPDRD